MENRINKAKEIHNKGGNCCQAVVCAFADLLNKDEETLYSAAEGFGLGMGNMNCTCGAVSGMPDLKTAAAAQMQEAPKEKHTKLLLR